MSLILISFQLVANSVEVNYTCSHNKRTWKEAENFCRENGGVLAQRDVINVINSRFTCREENDGLWVGLRRRRLVTRGVTGPGS